MNRRDALKAIAALPIIGRFVRSPDEIQFAGVKETPQLVGKVKIYLDGKLVRRPVRADARKGWCEYIACNSEGTPFLNETGTGVVRAIAYGVVRIERKSPPTRLAPEQRCSRPRLWG